LNRIVVALVALSTAWLAAQTHRAGGGAARAEADLKPHLPFGIVAFDLNAPARAAVARLGVGVVRGSCRWADVEPAPGAFDWRCTDNVILTAAAMRVRSYMTISCTPDWANGGRGCGVMPSDLADWSFFAANFVSRYSKASAILGVWNEPNFELRDSPAGSNYAALFIAASAARNSVSRGFALAGPETSHHAVASGYLQQVMEAIQTARAFEPQDIVGVHWYPDGPPVLEYLDGVRAVSGNQEVWVSETGIAVMDPANQADFYGRMLRTFATSERPWWTHTIFYRLWDSNDCCTEAILKADYSAKPAFETYRNWINIPRAIRR